MRFLNPIYLSGLILIAVPIIIHLLFRRNLKKILFSSLSFLKSTESERLRWLRLKEILVLIARCIMVASIFLALARPQYEGRFFTKNKLAAVYLVIDNSLSMRYGKNFEIALNQSEKLINAYSSKSTFYVVPLCSQKDFKPFWANQNTALDQLKKIKLSFSTGSLKPLYEKYLTEETNMPKEFIYVGDGQIANFIGMNKMEDFFWVRIPAGTNVAIEKVSLKNPYIIPKGNKYEMEVNIRNFGVGSFNTKVELIAGDFRRENEIIITGGCDAVTFFSLPLYIRNGMIKVNKDSLPEDNIYYFSKSLPEKVKVLIVGDSKYIKMALSPSPAIETPFEIDNRRTLKEVDLRSFNILILNGIEEITEFDLLKLQNFLSLKRTGLILYVGTKVGPQMRKLISDFATLEEWLVLEGFLNIKWVDTDYKPFSLFRDNPSLGGIKVFTLWKIKPKSRVLVKLDNNLPF